MPLFLPEGVRVPSGDDPYDLTTDLRKMAESTVGVIPVANESARATLLTNLSASGRPASPARPVYVHQSDSGVTWKNDGSGWVPLGAPESFVNGTLNTGTYTSSALIVSRTLNPVPYARRLMVSGVLYGSAITGTWNGALSVDMSQVDDAQCYARFPDTATTASVSMSMTFDLPANAATNVRMWYQRASLSGSITTSMSVRFNRMDVMAFQA